MYPCVDCKTQDKWVEAGEVCSYGWFSLCAARNVRAQYRNGQAAAVQWFPVFSTELFIVFMHILIVIAILSMLAVFLVCCKNIMQLKLRKQIYGTILITDLMST